MEVRRRPIGAGIPPEVQRALDQGRRLISRHQFVAAESLFQKVVAKHPEIYVHCRVLDAIVKQNRLDDAIAYWESLRETDVLLPIEWIGSLGSPMGRDVSHIEVWQNKYEDLLAKKEHGYVYRPRRRT